jgi:V/A-type H+/Na+-transporting ATPase subunit F
MNYRIAIVGTPETVAGFTLLGVEAVPVEDAAQAVEEIFRLKRATHTDAHGIERNDYAIIFATEDLLQGLGPDDRRKLSRGALPAIIPLPSHAGATGYGQQRLRTIVERAIGSNILG